MTVSTPISAFRKGRKIVLKVMWAGHSVRHAAWLAESTYRRLVTFVFLKD